MKLILILAFLVQSMSAFADTPVVEAEVSCDEVVRLIDDINSRVSSDKMIELVSCEETYDELFKGLVKKNFRAKVQLDTKTGVCKDNEFVEKKPTSLGHGVDLGTNLEKRLKVLEGAGFMRGKIMRLGGLHGNLLMELHYPVCD